MKLPLDIPIGRKYISYVGATPFYLAAQNGDAAYMRVLAAGGADTKLNRAKHFAADGGGGHRLLGWRESGTVRGAARSGAPGSRQDRD